MPNFSQKFYSGFFWFWDGGEGLENYSKMTIDKAENNITMGLMFSYLHSPEVLRCGRAETLDLMLMD